MTTTKNKSDLTGKKTSIDTDLSKIILSDFSASSESESDHSPYRLNKNKHMNNTRHGMNHKTKPKRIRTIFTPEQLERLESEFDKQQYMVGNERFYLATTLDLTEAQVKVEIGFFFLSSICKYFFDEGLVSKSSNQMASSSIR